MAHMHRAGGVGRNEFDVDMAARASGGTAKVLAGGQGGLHDALPDQIGQPQVQEPRASHFGSRNPRVFRKSGGQGIGNHPRRLASGFGQHHRGIGRHVAMRRIARRLDRDVGQVEALRQRALGGHGPQFSHDQRADIGE